MCLLLLIFMRVSPPPLPVLPVYERIRRIQANNRMNQIFFFFPDCLILMFHCKNKRSHTFNQPSGPLWAYSWGSVCFLSVLLRHHYTATERQWLRFNLVTLFLVSWPRSVVLAWGRNLHKNLSPLNFILLSTPHYFTILFLHTTIYTLIHPVLRHAIFD